MNPLSRAATWAIWVVLFAQLMYMNASVMPGLEENIKDVSDIPECAYILDLEIIGITKQKAMTAFKCMGEEGRKAYWNGETHEDAIYPFSYGLFFAFSLFALGSFCFRSKWLIVFSALIPIATLVFDYMENHSIVMMIDQFPDIQDENLAMANFGNQIKWITFFISLGLLLIYAVLALIKAIKKKV